MQGKSEQAAVYGAVNYDPWGKPRIGDWIQTHTGVKFHLLDPRPEDFRIEDMAHALSNQCRFTGHVKTFYSIGEHSVRVAEYLMRIYPDKPGVFYGEQRLTGKEIAFAGLMHDTSEGYTTDVARPIKQLAEFKFFRDIEDTLAGHIADAYLFAFPLPEAVKLADEILLGTEARDLMAPVIDGWHFRYGHLKGKIRPWSPRKAKRKFLKLFYKLNTQGIKRPRRKFFGWLAAPLLMFIALADDPRFDHPYFEALEDR